ncbi:MAG: hypothetical protein COA42_16790 [Alteromonadaceae bacterium]|nr:MAG: hypothetical protein COA42_16790 [Alteromonadaceae bacterium]
MYINIEDAPPELWVGLVLIIVVAGFPLLLGIAICRCFYFITGSAKKSGEASKITFLKVFLVGWSICTPVIYLIYKLGFEQ